MITGIHGLRCPGSISFLDKMEAMLLSVQSLTWFHMGQRDHALSCLRQATQLAAQFDRAPDYTSNHIRFYQGDPLAMAYDDMGTTAMESIRNTLSSDNGSQEILTLWKEAVEHEA